MPTTWFFTTFAVHRIKRVPDRITSLLNLQSLSLLSYLDELSRSSESPRQKFLLQITIRGWGMIVTRERRVFRFPSLDPIRYRVPLSRLNQFLHRVDIQSVDTHPLPRGSIGQYRAVPQRRHTCMRMHIHIAHTWRRRRGGVGV